MHSGTEITTLRESARDENKNTGLVRNENVQRNDLKPSGVSERHASVRGENQKKNLRDSLCI